MDSPSIRMSPEVGASSPAINPSSVDLPLPDGPITEINWPSGIFKSSECRIVSISAPDGTILETLYNSIMNFLRARTVRPHVYFILFVVLLLAACHSVPPNSSGESRSKAGPPEQPAKSLPKIVAFGDSLTAGYGLPQAASYPSMLQKRLDADGLHYEVVNAGVSGDTSAGGVRRIDWALDGNVKVVIVELGANDILRGQPVDAMKANLADIIEKCKTHGATVVLAGMEAPTNSGADYRRGIHEAFQSLAREHNVTLIPFFLDGVAGIESLNQRDGIHPNEEGTKIVVETVYRSLRPLLETQRSTNRRTQSHSEHLRCRIF